MNLVSLILVVLWILMIIDCVRNEPNQKTWLLVLIFLNFIGAIIYFIICYLHRSNLIISNSRQKFRYAEAAVKNIGKAHQYLNLGDVLYEMGKFDEAVIAYQQALDKAPENPNALWGLASIEVYNKQLDMAKVYLQRLLKIEPSFKTGDASLLYGKALFELGEWEVAKSYLETDIKYWNHPESILMLAKILIQHEQHQEACDRLERMLSNLKASPSFHYRRHQQVAKQAEKLLKRLYVTA